MYYPRVWWTLRSPKKAELRKPVVVLTTILPTLVAQRWFAPDHQEEAVADP